MKFLCAASLVCLGNVVFATTLGQLHDPDKDTPFNQVMKKIQSITWEELNEVFGDFMMGLKPEPANVKNADEVEYKEREKEYQIIPPKTLKSPYSTVEMFRIIHACPLFGQMPEKVIKDQEPEGVVVEGQQPEKVVVEGQEPEKVVVEGQEPEKFSYKVQAFEKVIDKAIESKAYHVLNFMMEYPDAPFGLTETATLYLFGKAYQSVWYPFKERWSQRLSEYVYSHPGSLSSRFLCSKEVFNLGELSSDQKELIDTIFKVDSVDFLQVFLGDGVPIVACPVEEIEGDLELSPPIT